MPFGERERRAIPHQVGPARGRGVDAFQQPVIDGQHPVGGRLLHEESLQLLELGRIRRGHVVDQAEVAARVVQLPNVFLEPAAGLLLPRRAVNRAGEPAVGVDRAIAHDLEVLGLVGAGGVRIVERVDHAHALDRRLDDTVDALGLGQARRLEHGGSDVDDVVPLRSNLVGGLDALRPRDDHAVPGAAVVRGNLLGPHERRVARDGPARGHVRIGPGAAPVVVVLEHLLDRLRDAVEVRHLVEHAEHAALGARPVVPDDVEDQRVVELARVADGGEQPADLVVGVLAESRIDLHLAGEELLLVGAQLVPVLDVAGLGGELRALGHDSHLDLPRERRLAHLVPAGVEAALVLVDPLLGHVVRRMRRARREIHEERLVRRESLLELHPGDGLVGHVGHEVVARLVRGRDPGQAVVEARVPLVGLAADEAVELVEARAGRPAIGRPGGADLPRRRLVVLPEEARAVAVQPQHLRERRDLGRSRAGVAGKGRGDLGDAAHVVHVVVAAGEEGRPRGRAERRGVELVVAQAPARQLVRRRHAHGSAEGARHPEAHVVHQHDDARSAPPRVPSPRSAAAVSCRGRRARCCADSRARESGARFDRAWRACDSTRPLPNARLSATPATARPAAFVLIIFPFDYRRGVYFFSPSHAHFSFTLGIGKVAVTTRVSPCVFTRAPVSQK